MNELARYLYNSSVSKEKRNELLKKVDVNYCTPDTLPGKTEIRRWAGYTSLHFAVERDDWDLATELLRQGADVVKQSTEDGYTPLHLVMDKLYDCKTYGLEKYTIREVQIIYSWIDSLLSRQVEINNIINPKCKKGISHLHIACLVNHVEAVELFVKSKECLNQAISNYVYNLEGYTPLHCAINSLSVEAADVLLRHGADIHVKNTKGLSCVELLVQCIMDINKEKIERLESIIKLVLKLSPDNETLLVDSGLSAFHLACILKDKSIAEDFLKKNVDVNMPVNSESKFWPGWMPIHFAACFNIDMMILLMQKGANLMIKNSRGETALDLCAKSFTAAEIKLVLSMENRLQEIFLTDNCMNLLDLLSVMDNRDTFHDFLQKLKNVNVTIPQNSSIWPGYNLLHISVSLNEKTKFKILLKSYSKETVDLPETNEHYNSTARQEALYAKRIKLLLEHGCDVDMTNSNGQTPVHLAFGMRSKTTAKKLLTHSEDNVVDQEGFSHLHIACVLGHLDAVKRYLNQGADVNCRVTSAFTWSENEPGILDDIFEVNWTPLHLAVIFGQNDVVEYLLESNADFYAQDSLGFTPIHLTMSKSPSVSKSANLLLKATPNLRDYVSSVGLSHLHVAAWANNPKVVNDLLHNGAEIDSVIDPDVEKSFPPLKNWAGETPLLVARFADVTVVASLVKAGANVHAKDLEGSSALQRALRHVFSMSTGPIIHKVRVGECEVDSYGITRLHVACVEWDLEWARRLLENGADANARIDDEQNDYHGGTPLYVLVIYALVLGINEQELLDFVQLLLDYGADVNIVKNGSTALHILYSYNYLDVFVDHFVNLTRGEFFMLAADLLLRSLNSYDVNPVNYQGLSHFHFACVRNDVETATKFLDHGADVNETMDFFEESSHGFAPLHSAIAYQCRELAHLLLDRGADVNKEDVHGNRPLHVAAKMKFFELPLIDAMISRGADYHAKNLNDETFLYCFLQFSDLNVNEYLQAFDRLMSYGFDLDQEDVKGTPLNEAAYFYNLEAAKALLQLGADMNAVDMEIEFPLDEMIAAAQDFNQRQIEIVKTLTCHVWKMKFIGLDARDSNLRCLERVEESFSLISSLEQTCLDELTKARETEICQGLTVNDFLSELGAVAEYPRMSSIRQGIVGNFFKHTADLRREFPEFCGFLAFQYKKIPPRMELWHSAKEATYLISVISNVDLPDLCVEAILRFFTNSEMKLLIESVKEFM